MEWWYLGHDPCTSSAVYRVTCMESYGATRQTADNGVRSTCMSGYVVRLHRGTRMTEELQNRELFPVYNDWESETKHSIHRADVRPDMNLNRDSMLKHRTPVNASSFSAAPTRPLCYLFPVPHHHQNLLVASHLRILPSTATFFVDDKWSPFPHLPPP